MGDYKVLSEKVCKFLGQYQLHYLEDFTPQECKECVMYPTCGGPCQKRFSEDSNWSCFLKNTHFNLSEYVLTQFKTHLIKQQIYDSEE